MEDPEMHINNTTWTNGAYQSLSSPLNIYSKSHTVFTITLDAVNLGLVVTL